MEFLLYGYLFVDTGTFRVPAIASTTTVIAYCKSQNETGGGVQLSWWLLAFLVFSSSRLRGETSYLPASNSVSPLARIIMQLRDQEGCDLRNSRANQHLSVRGKLNGQRKKAKA
jgi:hypothetical protein